MKPSTLDAVMGILGYAFVRVRQRRRQRTEHSVARGRQELGHSRRLLVQRDPVLYLRHWLRGPQQPRQSGRTLHTGDDDGGQTFSLFVERKVEVMAGQSRLALVCHDPEVYA